MPRPLHPSGNSSSRPLMTTPTRLPSPLLRTLTWTPVNPQHLPRRSDNERGGLVPQPPSLTLQLPSPTLQLPSLTLQLPSPTLQLPSLTLQLPSLTLQLPSLMLRPPSLTLQLPSLTILPPLPRNPPRKNGSPRRQLRVLTPLSTFHLSSTFNKRLSARS